VVLAEGLVTGALEKDEVDADKIMMFASAVADKEE
jgi:hypothetical protein